MQGAHAFLETDKILLIQYFVNDFDVIKIKIILLSIVTNFCSHIEKD